MGRNDSSLNHIDSPVTERSQRPVADHVINLKPEWFEQLEQKRRHSDQEVKPVVDIDMIFNGDEKEEKVERKKISLIRSDPILDIERLKLSMKPLLESRRSSTTAPFIIPELPCGRELVIEMLENWGDEETIGLNGIEIFESVQGKVTAFESVTMKWKSETTNCRSETIKWKSETMKWKSEMKSEKSLEQKLFSGPFRTHDDHHIWSCDWDPGVPLQIHITFHSSIRLALLRFWNYNKSRIHSYRGVKNVQVRLDNQIVFKGEIAKASGELRCQPEKLGDVSLIVLLINFSTLTNQLNN